MKIRMLKETKGSDNGIDSRTYPEGWVGKVSESLGAGFVRRGVAEKVEEKEFSESVKQNKMKTPKENPKMENKSAVKAHKKGG